MHRLLSSAATAALLLLFALTSHQALADEFSDPFKNMVRELSKAKIPRPTTLSFDESWALSESVHFKIYGVTKEICLQENIKPSDCLWSIEVERSPDFNAYATGGNRIFVSSGLIDQTTFDDEVAFVIAHEVAHHLLNHIGKGTGMIFVGAILGDLVFNDLAGGVIVGSLARQIGSRSFESQADAIALRIISRAGYSPKRARYVLMRMAKMDQRLTSRFMQSHPSGVERLVAFDSTLEEL